MCPRNDESAGKRRSTRLRQGDPWLKTLLIQCAWAASRAKQTALAASILTAAYHMLKDGTLYQDLGPDHFKRQSKQTQTQHLVKRLNSLGFVVALEPMPQAA